MTRSGKSGPTEWVEGIVSTECFIKSGTTERSKRLAADAALQARGITIPQDAITSFCALGRKAWPGKQSPSYRGEHMTALMHKLRCELGALEVSHFEKQRLLFALEDNEARWGSSTTVR